MLKIWWPRVVSQFKISALYQISATQVFVHGYTGIKCRGIKSVWNYMLPGLIVLSDVVIKCPVLTVAVLTVTGLNVVLPSLILTFNNCWRDPIHISWDLSVFNVRTVARTAAIASAAKVNLWVIGVYLVLISCRFQTIRRCTTRKEVDEGPVPVVRRNSTNQLMIYIVDPCTAPAECDQQMTWFILEPEHQFWKQPASDPGELWDWPYIECRTY